MEDLQEYVRDVMGQMESDLGVGTEWVAINHWNTDNPHAHVILRVRTREGHELRIPRDCLSHGLRHQARERATAELGERSIFDERMALDRDIHAKGFSRLDKALAAELDGRGEIRLQDLGGRDPDQAIWGNALRARARELEARGLATEVRRNVMAFKDGWTETLAERSRVDITKTRNTTKLHERGEEVVGEVVGLERRATGNSVPILDTGNKAKTMVNTMSPLVDHLQKGSWVHVDEIGHLSRLSYHPLKDQLGATAFTALDRELDRIGRGEERFFTGDACIDPALASRASGQGLGLAIRTGSSRSMTGQRTRFKGQRLMPSAKPSPNKGAAPSPPPVTPSMTAGGLDRLKSYTLAGSLSSNGPPEWAIM
jgi:hypothetical protein